MRGNNRNRGGYWNWALVALPFVALVVALMVFTLGHSASGDAEATGPSQSLGAFGPVDCGAGKSVPVAKPTNCTAFFIPGSDPKTNGTQFQITLNGNDVPAISGFGAEVVPGGLTYNPRAACADAVQLTPLVVCTSAIGVNGKIQFGGSTGPSAPFPAADGTPGSVVLLELDMHCSDEGQFKVVATNNPRSGFGSVFFSVPGGDPIAVTKEGGATGEADSLLINCMAIILTNPLIASFRFRNPDPVRVATDFKVVIVDAPPPAIGGGFGGAPFPTTNLQLPATGGGFLRVVYDGGPGIPAGGEYTHSFPGWPAGTRLRVSFSYSPDEQAPIIVEQGTFPTQGSTGPSSVGGIAVSGDLAGLPLETADSSGPNAGLLAGVIAGATAGVVALGGAAWYARRRWLR